MSVTRDVTAAFRAARDQLLELREDHARAVAEFTWPDVGDRFNWAIDWFDHVADERGDATALIVARQDGSTSRRSWRELREASDRLAAWLAEHGVGRGDPVLIMLDNQVELWESMLAVMKLGAIILPTTTAVTATDLTERVGRSGARHAIANAVHADRFAGIPEPFGRFSVGPAERWHDLADAAARDWAPTPHPGTAPGDPLLLYFTSGTTSRPKLVEHTQISYPVGHLATMYFIGARPGDVHLNISSPGWAKHAWSCFFAPWIAEATILVLDYARFDASGLRELLDTHAVNSFCAPPTVWRMLLQGELGERPAALGELMGAGEPLNPEVIDRIERAWGLTIRDGFGQTETSAQVGNSPGAPVKPGSMGRPLPGVPVAIVDPVSGVAIEGPGEGEICLDLSRSPLGLMRGYRDDSARNAEAMAGGFYHTGDVAARDGDGYIFYIGRTDDVFKASDYKISPFELESVLIEHDAVAEAAVVPAPDPVRLAVPKAYVTLAPGWSPDAATATAILAHARGRLNPYQRIRRIEFTVLPKTISGKIRRVELRQREAGLADGSVTREPGTREFRDDEIRS